MDWWPEAADHANVTRDMRASRATSNDHHYGLSPDEVYNGLSSE